MSPLGAGLAWLNWSGGKDSMLTLHAAAEAGVELSLLLTTISAQHQRISMHGVRRTLLEAQAAALGKELRVVELPEGCSMEEYAAIMQQAVQQLVSEGYAHCYFGDIHLADLRHYREQQLGQLGVQAHFPLWAVPSKEIVQHLIDLNYRGVLVCVNSNFFDDSYLGRHLDAALLRDMPTKADPAGERGEYHSFVYDGPLFRQPVQFSMGEIVHRVYEPQDSNSPAHYDKSFAFLDLIPAP